MSRIKLVQTCGACPEQYDVYIDGEKLGYMRLRHGYFRAEYCGEVVFEGYPRGDGCFDVEEKTLWLNRACSAIFEKHNLSSVPLYEIEVPNEDELSE